MIIDQDFLNQLSSRAVLNPRLRQNYDLRNSEKDDSQRMLNAMEPGTEMPIHRHRNSSETIVMVRGGLRLFLYDNDGCLTGNFLMEAGGQYPMIQIEAGQWHSLEVLQEGTVVFEAKGMAYEPLAEEDIMHK